MFPKVGDIVYLNHDFLKIWFRRGNKYLKEEVWKESFTITRIGSFVSNEFIVRIESKNKTYELNVKSNGEFSTCSDKYKGIQVFVPANPEIDNDIYCSCNGPKKENWIFGEKFYVCTICKKEVI